MRPWLAPLLGGLATLLCSCGDTTLPVPQTVAEVREIIDPLRSTPANGEAAGRPDRLLETRVWYAERPPQTAACQEQRCGLLVLAHGFGGSTARFDAIAERLAKHGYIAAAVRFPLTNEAAPGGFSSGINDVVEQPGDLSAVIDALLAADRDPEDRLFGRIDPSRIAAIGHSLGGTTVAAASRLDCCRDPRLGATVYVEPGILVVEPFFGAAPASEGPPALTLHGELDAPFPRATFRAFHESLSPPSILVELAGGDHVNMIERHRAEPDPLLDVAAETIVAFLDESLAGRSGLVSANIARLRESGHTVSDRR